MSPGTISCKEQVTDRCAACHAVHNKRNAWRDDDAEAAGDCDDCGGEGPVISEAGKDRDRHTADCGYRSRGRSGDRTVEQTGDNDGTRHASRESAEKIGKDIEQLLGDAALCHDDT